MKKINVLMIDDNLQLVDMVKEYFSSHASIEVIMEAYDGEEGFRKIKDYQDKYDLKEPKQRRLQEYRSNRARGILLTSKFLVDLLNNDIIMSGEENNVDK